MTDHKILPEPLTQPAKEYRAQREKYESDFLDKMASESLTTPPAPTVMGHDVRDAVQVLQPLVDAWEFSSEITFAIKTLIRAATAPKQAPPLATDAQKQALEDFEDGYVVSAPDGDETYIFEADTVQQIKAALQSPAVPREVVKTLRIIASGGEGEFQWSMTKAEKMARETLALLGGNEG